MRSKDVIWQLGCGSANENWSLDSKQDHYLANYFLKYSHLAIAAKLYCPKGDRINESLL